MVDIRIQVDRKRGKARVDSGILAETAARTYVDFFFDENRNPRFCRYPRLSSDAEGPIDRILENCDPTRPVIFDQSRHSASVLEFVAQEFLNF